VEQVLDESMSEEDSEVVNKKTVNKSSSETHSDNANDQSDEEIVQINFNRNE